MWIFFLLSIYLFAVQSDGEAYRTYGAEPTLKQKPETLSEALGAKDRDHLMRIRGKVTAVCQRKGCWMLLTDGKNTARTTFKDYAFFVPKDISGKEMIVEGMLTETTISEQEARHYAEDAGKSTDEIQSIHGEQKGYLITAVSVQIPEQERSESRVSEESPDSAHEKMIARAKALELNTDYTPPPGEALEHHAAGFAKILCSAVFITGLDPDFAAENVGYFTGPYDQRAKMGKPVIDRVNRAVHVGLPNGVRRTARYLGDQGCVTLPTGKDSLNFTPIKVENKLPDPSTQPWPMGDVLPREDLPKEIDASMVKQAVDAAFEPSSGMTAAFVVTWKGRIIGERYGAGIKTGTPLESWSMGKSLTATLMGILIMQGIYDLWQTAPVPEWQSPGDPRAGIRIADILQMSSGLRIRAPQDPDYDPSGPYPDHLYLYTGGVNSFQYAATRPLQWPPGTVGRYRNTDPVLINYLIRLGVEKRGEEYLSFPRRALFDKIGIRTMVMETDPFGNFLTQGYELASARDWARLGNLYLQDGLWNGERILPEGYVKFVSSLAPAWEADRRPIYGGFFWINGSGYFPAPREAYYMTGAGGQTTLIVPSHDLVIVRLGHYKGQDPGTEAFKKAIALLMRAVPQNNEPQSEKHSLTVFTDFQKTDFYPKRPVT